MSMERALDKKNKSESVPSRTNVEKYDFFKDKLQEGFSSSEAAFNEQLYAIHKALEDLGHTMDVSSLHTAQALVLDAEQRHQEMVESKPHLKPLEATVRRTIAHNIESCKQELLAIKKRLDGVA